MQNTSALYQQIIADAKHYFEVKVNINGVDYGEDEIFSLSTDRAVFDYRPTIGNAVAGEINLTILKPSVAIPRMAQIIPYIRACVDSVEESPVTIDNNGVLDVSDVATMSNNNIVFNNTVALIGGVVFFNGAKVHLTSEWLQMGVFFIDTRQTTHNDDGVDKLIIHGYDAMLFGEANYPSTNHAWPVSDISVVNEIAQTMGVDVDQRTVNYLTSGYEIQLPTGYTMRETLGHIAGAYCGNFVMSQAGKLLFLPLMGLSQEDDTVGSYLADESDNALLLGNEGWYILV